MTTRQIIVLGKKPSEAEWSPMWLYDMDSMKTYIEGLLEEINLPHGIKMYCNAEFLLVKNDVNIILATGVRLPEAIFGNVFLASTNDDGEIISLSDSQVEWICENTEVVVLPTFKNPVFRFTFCEGGN